MSWNPAQWTHIPGPNPLLRRGPEGAWDNGVIEACDVLRDAGVYYLYYHGHEAYQDAPGAGYRIGVATAPRPLGPFVRAADGPILDLGEPGAWDDHHVACAFVLRESVDEYLMWYSGYGNAPEHQQWGIGLARASSPLGPWQKHPANPLLPHFGYLGGVVKHEGRYLLYCEHPIGSTGEDYGPISLAIADKPEGPYAPCEDNPVMGPGERGEWDDGGVSEAEVFRAGERFHVFYGGAKEHPTRMMSRESIGYAWSDNGRRFHKSALNPVAPREAVPNAAAFGEVHTLVEPPFAYLYHTLRYKEPAPEDAERFPTQVEDLGVEVIALQRPFRLAMPWVALDRLDAGQRALAPEPLCPGGARVESVTLACEVESKQGTLGTLHAEILTSADGVRYDTEPLDTLSLELPGEGRAQQTFECELPARFARVRLSTEGPVALRDVTATATLRD